MRCAAGEEGCPAVSEIYVSDARRKCEQQVKGGLMSSLPD